MKTHHDSDEAIYSQLTLETAALEEFFARASNDYHNTPAILGKPWYGIGLESNAQDEQKDQANKSGIITKMLQWIIDFIKRVLGFIERFFSSFDVEKEKENHKEAEEIIKNNQHSETPNKQSTEAPAKAKKPVDFVNDVVEKLPVPTRVTICAIEKDISFTNILHKNINADRSIRIPATWSDDSILDKNQELVEIIENGIDLLDSALRDAESKSDDERDAALIKSLKGGLSINGSENGEFLFIFKTTQEVKKKYNQLLRLAEEFLKSGAPRHVVDDIKIISGILSKQFAMETRIFTAYIKLNKAVIEVNNAIHAKN